MVKFVASDLDGTLLLNGAQSVDESTIQYINKLVDKGVIFAPASCRQITSLKRLFGVVSDKLAYIAENGALVEYKGETIGKTAMDRKLALEIIEDVIEQPNCEVLVSGEHTSYIKPKSQEYYYRMTKVVNYHTTLVDKFTDIDEDILKIAVCDMTGIKNWSDKASVLVSGELYLDLMDTNVNKGRGIEQVQQYFGLKPEECMAFGDNYNDVDMLDSVTYSYVMSTAAEDIKKHGRYITDWVEKSLRESFKDILG